MIIFQIFVALGLPVFLGISFIKYLETDKQLPLFLLVPIGFGLGFGFLTQWMLLLSVVQVRYSHLTITLPFFTTGIVFFILKYMTGKQRSGVPAKPLHRQLSPDRGRGRFLAIPLVVYIVYILSFVCLRSLTVPVLEWDAVSFIALKGKIFFYEKSIYQHAFLPNSSYPLHVPLALAWVALNLNEWSETLVKVVFPAYFLAYCMLHYGTIRLYLNKIWALASLALLVSAYFFNYHATIAYRDITLMYYFCGGILLLILWHKMKNEALLASSALFLGFASWVKLEGVLCTGIGLVGLIFMYGKVNGFKSTRAWSRLLRLCLVPAAIFLFYYIYRTHIGAEALTQNLDFARTGAKLFKNLDVLAIILKELLYSPNWHMIWLLYLLSLFPLRRIMRCLPLCLLSGTIFLFFAVYVMLGLTTGVYDSLAGIGSSSVLSRVILHVYPLAVFFIALANGAQGNPDDRGKLS